MEFQVGERVWVIPPIAVWNEVHDRQPIEAEIQVVEDFIWVRELKHNSTMRVQEDRVYRNKSNAGKVFVSMLRTEGERLKNILYIQQSLIQRWDD